jgi:tetratricopeptide (TPR) repeat protein
MYDMKPLEEEWEKYKLKQKRPWYIVLVTILIVTLLFSIMYKKNFIKFNNINLKYFNIDVNNIIVKKKQEDNNIVMNSALIKLETNSDRIVLSKTKDENSMLVDIPILNVQAPTSSQRVIEKDRPTIHLDIIETSNVTAYKDVEKRFLQSHDIDDSLFLAKSYYKKGKYKKAEHWAYETNKLNANVSESLFIFIKSKVKLGKKNEAISILRNYISKTNSSDGKMLLSQIENNQL